MTVMLYRALKLVMKNEDFSVNEVYNFTDCDIISDWAIDAVTYMYDRKIMLGISNESAVIDPKSNIKCNHAVLLLERIVNMNSIK